jgi:tRNA-2-methylthio-N6-dimethylallyladenosine synthase
VQERFLRLTALQDRISHEENLAQVGRTVQVLVAEAEGRKDGSTHRVTGRAADNRLVHLALPPDASDAPRPGDLVTVEVTHAAPYHLVADSALSGGTFTVRRTASGDAWDRRRSGTDEHSHGGSGDSCGTGGPAGPVALGLPTLARR